MEYTKEELNKVRLKIEGEGIHEIPLNYDYLEVMPELKTIDETYSFGFFEWAGTEDGCIIVRNKIIRYINFMYSMELTCIKQNFPGYRERKVECAILAGFEYDPNNGKFDKRVEEMLSCNNSVVNRMIICFLRKQYSDPYAAIVAMREVYYRGMEKVLNDKDAGPNEIIEWGKSEKSLREMELNFLSGDESKPLTAALVKKIEEESLGLRPEDVAFKIKAGKDPLDGYDFYRY